MTAALHRSRGCQTGVARMIPIIVCLLEGRRHGAQSFRHKRPPTAKVFELARGGQRSMSWPRGFGLLAGPRWKARSRPVVAGAPHLNTAFNLGGIALTARVKPLSRFPSEIRQNLRRTAGGRLGEPFGRPS